MTNDNNEKTIAWSGKDWLLLAGNAVIWAIFYFAFNDRMPDTVASHFNFQGEQDRTMAKGAFWLMYAGLGIALPALLSVIRFADPRRQNYSRFKDYYYVMRWAISLFLHGVFLLIILTSLNEKLPHMNILLGGLGVLWVIIGNRMGQLKSNFFIGIRTPWALMDENNWRLTHRLGGRLWVAAGLVMFASAWFVSVAAIPYVLISSALFSSLIPFVYSYLLFARPRTKTK